MIGITGSLAMNNAQRESDVDLVVINEKRKIVGNEACGVCNAKAVQLLD